MMIIKSPIELKVRTDLMHGYDAFGERIAGNYALMGLEIGEEELLHMVSSPPEIYLMEEGTTTIGGNTIISSRNEEKFNIVNNMLNRILLSVDGELTYQDRTYITDTLHKLGIRDDRKFMKEVRRMINESHLEQDFVDNYLEMRFQGQSRELRERTLELTKELVERELYESETSREEILGERIMHRLQTGAIYQIVANFNKSLNDTRIEFQESMISAQENVARRLLVQNILHTVVQQTPELVFREGSEGSGYRPEETVGGEGYRQPEALQQELQREEHFESTERVGTETSVTEQILRERERELRTEREGADIVHREETSQEYTDHTIRTELLQGERETTIRDAGEPPLKVPEQDRPEAERTQDTTTIRETETRIEGTGERQVLPDTVSGDRLREEIRSEQSSVYGGRDSERVTEHTERYTSGQDTILHTEREGAELVYREEPASVSEEETETAGKGPASLRERLERERQVLSERLELERNRLHTAEQTVLELEAQLRETLQTQETAAGEPESPIMPERETVTEHTETVVREEAGEIPPAERIPGRDTETVLETRDRISESTETVLRSERSETILSGQEPSERTAFESTEMVLREERPSESEEGEEGQKTVRIQEPGRPERERQILRERLAIERDRLQTARQTVSELEQRIREFYRTEREAAATPDQGTVFAERTPATGEETVIRDRQESILREEQLPGRDTTTITEDRLRILEEREAKTRTERTERYVTEQKPFLRTGHTESELIYREGQTPAEGEAPAGTLTDTLRESERLEREILSERERLERERERSRESERSVLETRSGMRETTHTIQSSERIPGVPAQDTEREPTDTAGTRIREGREESLPDTEIPIPGRDTEKLPPDSVRITEQAGQEIRTDHTDRYVTEQQPVLRTEHESSELIYREEAAAAAAPEGAEARLSETIRETERTERERMTGREYVEKETDRSHISESVVSAVRSELREELRTERTTGPVPAEVTGQAGGTGSERTEVIYREGSETVLPGQTAAGRDTVRIREETERVLSTSGPEQTMEHTERYVTEGKEILRTEPESADILYRTETVTREGEASEELLRETLLEGERLERTYRTERERLEKERESSRTQETERTEQRSEVREQLRTEGAISLPEGEGMAQPAGSFERSELIYRETSETPETAEAKADGSTQLVTERIDREIEQRSERERLERERLRSEEREELLTSVRSELREEQQREQLRTEHTETVSGTERLTERESTETIRTGQASAIPGREIRREHEGAEMIYRQETVPTQEEAERQGAGQILRENRHFQRENIYERELRMQERSRSETGSGLTAAVLLEVVQNLFHAGADRIGRGDTWIEYRGALYRSSENVFNRLNIRVEEAESPVTETYLTSGGESNIEHVSLTELQEFSENAEEAVTIENTIREMNEMNLQNVERYQKMLQVLQNIRTGKKETGGKERTMQEALSLMDQEQILFDELRNAEDQQEQERREVFREITRIFPENNVEIFRVIEQYMDGTADTSRVGITRNNVEAAAEEIQRITAAARRQPEPVSVPEDIDSSELVYRRNAVMTQEEIEEAFESFRQSENRQRREMEQRREILETERRNTYSVTTNAERTLSRQEAEDIEAIVSRGVRSQMGAISEQVLQKLEKKLKNEKIRRGI